MSWSQQLGFDQAELIEGTSASSFCSGQDAVDADGTPQHEGDMAAVRDAVDNLEAILTKAGMSLANVVRLNAYTTDFDELLKHWANTHRALREPRRRLRDHPASASRGCRRRGSPRDAGGHRGR